MSDNITQCYQWAFQIHLHNYAVLVHVTVKKNPYDKNILQLDVKFFRRICLWNGLLKDKPAVTV